MKLRFTGSEILYFLILILYINIFYMGNIGCTIVIRDKPFHAWICATVNYTFFIIIMHQCLMCKLINYLSYLCPGMHKSFSRTISTLTNCTCY